MSNVYHLQSVDRVVKVLSAFNLETPEWRLVDIAELLGIHKTQALRIVSTLESEGYLVRNPSTKRYRLGLPLFHLGMTVREGMEVFRIARPHLLRLVGEIGEDAMLMIPDVDGPICVDHVESPSGVKTFARLGARMPWNAGSGGKVILAYLPEHLREEILANSEFQRYNELTITDPDVLRQEAVEIRRRGFYVSRGDLTLGAQGAAVPIFNKHREIAGAIGINLPERVIDPTDAYQSVARVTKVATEVSTSLGFAGELQAVE